MENPDHTSNPNYASNPSDAEKGLPTSPSHVLEDKPPDPEPITKAVDAKSTRQEPAEPKDKRDVNDLNPPPHAINPYAQYIAPEAPIWARYLDEAEVEGKELIDPWSGTLDALLIFAGLFAAILTAFLVESRKELVEDPQERLLRDILRALRNASDSADSPPFQPEPAFVNINGLWFSGLTLTLSSALGGVLAKGWISKYSGASLRKTSRDACSRMLRSTRIRQWEVGGIITSISLLIQIALWLFFIGLGYLLWDTPNQIKGAVLTLVSATALLYVVATFLPMVFPACPPTDTSYNMAAGDGKQYIQ
ncbi:hypothetical protein CPB86DRAFT_556667 [Serendipita vermifera]|nr:hypothetical protein CPB86DRAFT_556667 [Serendipita vermifera]